MKWSQKSKAAKIAQEKSQTVRFKDDIKFLYSSKQHLNETNYLTILAQTYMRYFVAKKNRTLGLDQDKNSTHKRQNIYEMKIINNLKRKVREYRLVVLKVLSLCNSKVITKPLAIS
jgi:hypothetical protein